MMQCMCVRCVKNNDMKKVLLFILCCMRSITFASPVDMAVEIRKIVCSQRDIDFLSIHKKKHVVMYGYFYDSVDLDSFHKGFRSCLHVCLYDLNTMKSRHRFFVYSRAKEKFDIALFHRIEEKTIIIDGEKILKTFDFSGNLLSCVDLKPVLRLPAEYNITFAEWQPGKNNVLLLVTDDSGIFVVDLDYNKVLQVIFCEDGVFHVAFNPLDEKFLALSTRSGKIMIVEVADRSVIREIKSHKSDDVTGCAPTFCWSAYEKEQMVLCQGGKLLVKKLNFDADGKDVVVKRIGRGGSNIDWSSNYKDVFCITMSECSTKSTLSIVHVSDNGILTSLHKVILKGRGLVKATYLNEVDSHFFVYYKNKALYFCEIVKLDEK